MPSPDATKIVIKCKEPERDEVKRLANLQGLTIQRYALKRLLLPWVDRDLEDLGFGLVLRAMRDKEYPDSYIKRMVGELLHLIDLAPTWTPEYDKYMEYMRDEAWRQELEEEAERYGL